MNEMLTQIAEYCTEGFLKELSNGNSAMPVAGVHRILNGGKIIDAQKEVSKERIAAQKEIIIEKNRLETLEKKNKTDIIIEAFRTIEALSRAGNLTETNLDRIEKITLAGIKY